MRKTFSIENTEYTVTTCTAIALDGVTEQEALLVENTADSGEKFQKVVFGYEMPETAEDFDAMSDDSSAWESDSDVLATVKYNKMDDLLDILHIDLVTNHGMTTDEILECLGCTVDEDGEIISENGLRTGIWYEEIEY